MRRVPKASGEETWGTCRESPRLSTEHLSPHTQASLPFSLGAGPALQGWKMQE